MWLLRFLIPLLWCRLIGTETKFRRSNPYVADAVGNTLPAPSVVPSKVGSPSILLTPDRYEFYTFDETGELVKQLMTLDEIQAIVASDDENEGHMVTLAQTDLHKPAIAFNFSHPPPVKVHSVVTNVQNVLKSQIEAHKKNPPNPQNLDTPDVSASWSMILPSIFGNTGVDIVPDKLPNSFGTPETDTVELVTRRESLDEMIITTESNIIPGMQPTTKPATITTNLQEDSFTSKPGALQTINNAISKDKETSTIAAETVIAVASSTETPITTIVENTILSSIQAVISNTPDRIPPPSPPLAILTSSSMKPTTESQTKVPLKTSIPSTPSFINTISFTTPKSVNSSHLLVNSSDQSDFVKISDSSNAMKLNSTTEKVSITEQTNVGVIDRNQIEIMKYGENDTSENDATSNTIKGMASTIITNEINKENGLTTPTLLSNVKITMTENPIQSESTAPKDSSINSVVETTTKFLITSHLINEIKDPKPIFNVAESISQIASDLGNQLNLPEIEQFDPEIKENMDVKLSTNEFKDADLTTQLTINGNISNQPSNNSNENISLTNNTDIGSSNFVKITTLEPNKLSTINIDKNNEFKIDNSTVSLETALDISTITHDTLAVNEETTIEPTLELSQSMNDLLSQVSQESPQPVIQISHLTDITTSESAVNRHEDLELIATVQPTSQKLETTTEITSTVPEIPPSTILDILSLSTTMPLTEGFTETTALFTLVQTTAEVTNPIELTESVTQPTTEITTNTVNLSTIEIQDDKFSPIAKLNTTIVAPLNEFVTDLNKYVTIIPTTINDEETTLKTSTKMFSLPSTNFYISENDNVTENISDYSVNESNNTTNRIISADTTEKTTSSDIMDTFIKTPAFSNQIILQNNTQKVVYSDENVYMAISDSKNNASSLGEIKNQVNTTNIENDAEFTTKVNNSVTEVEQKTKFNLSTNSSDSVVTSTNSTRVNIDDIKINGANDTDLFVPIITETTMKTSTSAPTSSLVELNITKEHNTEAMTKVEDTTKKININENSTDKIIESPENISTSSSIVKIEDPKKKVQKVNIDSKEHMDHAINNTWTLISTLPPPKYVAGHKNEKNNTNIKLSSSNVFKPQTRPLNNEPSKHINLDGSKENQGLEATTKDLNEDVFQFSELCNELAFRYWNAIKDSTEDNKRSLVFSPYAITSMLAMIFMGARGATSGEMNEILRLDDMVTFNPHFVLKNVSDSIEVSMRAGVVASTFVRELYSDRTRGKLLTFYKERAQHFYGGLVEETNFKLINDIIRRRTNLLVKRNTWSKIAEYLKANTITMRPPLAAFSANIFETDCSTSSTEGRDGEMYFVVSPSVRQRRLVPIPSVVYKKGFLAGYDPVLDATAASIGTGNQVTSTIFLMPGQQGNAVHAEDLDNLQKRIQTISSISGAWNRLMRTLLPRQGLELQVPRFAHRSLLNISSTLQSMGLKDLFDPEKADLRGLSGLSNDLYISDMMQSNFFATCGEGIIAEQHHVESYPDEPSRRRRSLWYSPSLSNAEYRWTDGWDEPRDYQRAFHDPHDLGVMYMPLHLRPRQARLPPTVAPEVARLKLDRPFLYFVRHNLSGIILYMGRFNPRLLP